MAFENATACLLLLADSAADTASIHLGILIDLAKGEPSLIAVGSAKNCSLCNNTSHTLTPFIIIYLFLVSNGILYLKVQELLAHDELLDTSPPPIVGKRRPGPKQPKYGIPTEHWPTVIRRVVEQKESLRTVAAAYGVSNQTIRRMLLFTHQQCGQQDL